MQMTDTILFTGVWNVVEPFAHEGHYFNKTTRRCDERMLCNNYLKVGYKNNTCVREVNNKGNNNHKFVVLLLCFCTYYERMNVITILSFSLLIGICRNQVVNNR